MVKGLKIKEKKVDYIFQNKKYFRLEVMYFWFYLLIID